MNIECYKHLYFFQKKKFYTFALHKELFVVFRYAKEQATQVELDEQGDQTDARSLAHLFQVNKQIIRDIGR